MSTIEVTRQARDELRTLIETRNLPRDTRARVTRSLSILGEFPRAGKRLTESGEIVERRSDRGDG